MNLLNFFDIDIDKLFLCRQLCCLDGEGGLGGKAVENYSAEDVFTSVFSSFKE